MGQDEHPAKSHPVNAVPAAEEIEVVRAEELFAGRREVVIDHNGERYRLRVTKRGRLLLQK